MHQSRKIFLSCILFLSFFLSSRAPLAADQGNVPAGLDVYSAVNFIEDEREFFGIQIVVVSYVEGDVMKRKVLWRSAGPFLNSPLLLDVVETDKGLRVVVPEEYPLFSGTWYLSLRGNAMIASKPNEKAYTLKKLTVK